MTTKSIFLSVAILASTVLFGQNITATQVPAQVYQAMQTKFPNATNLTWEMAQGYYVPVFKLSAVETAALIDLKGHVIQSETRLKPADLPVAATAYISQKYPNASISKVAKVLTSASNTRYVATVSGSTLVFDANGAFTNINSGPVVY